MEELAGEDGEALVTRAARGTLAAFVALALTWGAPTSVLAEEAASDIATPQEERAALVTAEDEEAEGEAGQPVPEEAPDAEGRSDEECGVAETPDPAGPAAGPADDDESQASEPAADDSLAGQDRVPQAPEGEERASASDEPSSAQPDSAATGTSDLQEAPAEEPRQAASTEEPASQEQPSGQDADTTSATPQEQAKPKPQPPANGWWTDPDTGVTSFYRAGTRQRGWVVTKLDPAGGSAGAKRRYWLDASYALARDRVVNPASSMDGLKGAYLAYARPDGSIVTGTYRTDGRIYLADKKGRLASLKKNKRRGWLISKAYDSKGKKRRYYLYRAEDGSYYAKSGYARDGYAHFVCKAGYVRTGIWKSGKKIYVADAKGKLASLKKNRRRGWLTTKAFDAHGKERRYYLYREKGGSKAGMCYARKGFSKDGYAHYTTKKGYVKTLTSVKVKGKWYVASERGKLERVTKAQAAMVRQAWETPPTGEGLCAAWVSNVAWRAGVGGTSGDACDLYAWYCSSADMHKIKPGTIIAVSKHSHTVAGSIWGHVGVYVGDGKVRDSVHGRTRTSKLSWWVSHYGTTVKPKWGWYGNRKLS